ncbi:MAG: amidohydrolase family protein [Cyclobacteriaceae bacterium]
MAHYARDEKAISLGNAINTSSSQTALALGLEERGFIKLGFMADIILFDLDLMFLPGPNRFSQ